MNRRDQMLARVAVTVVSVLLAFAVAVRWLGVSGAQEPANQATGESAPANPSAIGQESAPMTAQQTTTGISELEGFLEPFIYDIVNRRDPFQPYAEYVPTEDTGGSGRPLSPAQRFELEKLELIGILWDVKEPKAMFVDPDKEVLVLGRDESIGNRNGYIAAIREGEVVVVEALRKRGDIIYRTRVLRMDR